MTNIINFDKALFHHWKNMYYELLELTPHIMLSTEENLWDISPVAIRKLEFGENALTFYATQQGSLIFVTIAYSSIEAMFGGEEVN